MPKTSIKQTYSLSDILGEALSYEEAISLIADDPTVQQQFDSLTPDSKQKIISFIQGNTGLKILGDKCFKDIMKPHTHPERLNSLLSAILGRKVRIKSVLPTEGGKITEEGSFVIMDMLVEDAKGTTINVEIQRVGYRFPGERSNCYLADLIMRQYNKVRSQMGKRFSYHQMKPIILIVIMESSPDHFHAVSPHYIHREKTVFDSGVTIKNLTQTIYISLDTSRSIRQNISTMLDAWLTFLGSDTPTNIVKLINAYPEFIEYYKDIVEYRRHPKELMHMFSEALAIMDRNMEQYMIDEWKATIENQKSELQEIRSLVQEKDSTIKERDSTITKLETMIETLVRQNPELKSQLNEIHAQLQSK